MNAYLEVLLKGSLKVLKGSLKPILKPILSYKCCLKMAKGKRKMIDLKVL